VNTAVTALCEFNGDLYAGSDFAMTATGADPRLRRWNPALALWQPVGTGTNGPVLALAPYQGQLAIAGDFTIANNKVAGRWATLRSPAISDINCDGVTNIDDLLSIINAWGPCPKTVCPADTNNDDSVDVNDLLIVINNWSA
jgi:hypothetical protein